jgi:carbon monoxide dehydrogenase subunit G
VRFAHVLDLPAPPERVYQFLLDVPRLARLLPGTSDVRAAEADHTLGGLAVRIGPFGVALAGDVRLVARDDAARSVTLRASGADPRAGRLEAVITLRAQHSGQGTRLLLDSDVRVSGRLRWLPTAIMKRKSDQLIVDFARNLARELKAHA